MIDNQFSPEEQKLIQEIQQTPRLKLDSSPREAIREQMLAEFRAVQSSQLQTVRPALSLQQIAILIALIATGIVVGLIILQFVNQGDNKVDSRLIPSQDAQITIIPSATSPLPTETSTASKTPTPILGLESTISATEIATLQFPTETEIAPVPTDTQEVVLIVQGPIESINEDTIEIYDFTIEIESDHPIRQIIEVGDIVQVQGEVSNSGVMIAEIIDNLGNTSVPNGTATVGLDGPIEAINDNEIVVNGISIQLAPDDPLLQILQVGNFITVQGNFQTLGSTITLVVVNISVVNNVSVESNCWFHDDGMGMGHWHCDGMGMGGMGMGDDGMGMGN